MHTKPIGTTLHTSVHATQRPSPLSSFRGSSVQTVKGLNKFSKEICFSVVFLYVIYFRRLLAQTIQLLTMLSPSNAIKWLLTLACLQILAFIAFG